MGIGVVFGERRLREGSDIVRATGVDKSKVTKGLRGDGLNFHGGEVGSSGSGWSMRGGVLVNAARSLNPEAAASPEGCGGDMMCSSIAL